MKREIDINEISDGKLYDIDDLVRADTAGCGGCSACCHGVGELVHLNPFDVFCIRKATGLTFDALLSDMLVLRPNGKLLQPHLGMHDESEACRFLSTEGRCTIHEHRPSICRLFPLGRVYDDQRDFKYILLKGACVKPKLDKIRVSKWINIDDYDANKTFLLEWYRLNKALTFRMKFVREQPEIDAVNEFLFETFYRIEAADASGFYALFHEKLPGAKNKLGIL